MKNERSSLLEHANSTKTQNDCGVKRVTPVTSNKAFIIAVVFSSLILDFGSEAKAQYIIQITRELSQRAVNETLTQYKNETENSCGRRFNETTEEEILGQKLAAKWSFYCNIAEHATTLPVVMLFGIYSDKIGRKPLFLMSTVGMFLEYAIKAVAIYFKLPLYFFVLAAAVEGLTGCRYLFSIATNSSIADTTERNQSRTSSFALMDVFTGIGTFAAKLGTGYMISGSGFFFPVVLTAGLNFLMVIFIISFVPETLKRKVKTKSTCDLFRDSMSFLYDKTQLHGNKRWKFLFCFSIYISLEFSGMAVSGISTIYYTGFPLCWNSKSIGWYSASSSLIHTALGAMLLKLMAKKGRDEPLAIVGLLSSIGNNVLIGFASQSWMLYLGTSVGVLSLLKSVVIRSALSRMVVESKQGEDTCLIPYIYRVSSLAGSFFMVYQLVGIATVLAGNSLSTNIYQATVSILRGFPYLIAACLYFFVLIMVVILYISGGTQTKVVTQGSNTTQRSPNRAASYGTNTQKVSAVNSCENVSSEV